MDTNDKRGLMKTLYLIIGIYAFFILLKKVLGGTLSFSHTGGFIFSALLIGGMSYLFSWGKRFLIPFCSIMAILSSVIVIQYCAAPEWEDIYKITIAFASAVTSILFLLISQFKNRTCKSIMAVILLSIIFSAPIILWGYYALTGNWITTDAILALVQTNTKESMEYLHDNLSTRLMLAMTFFFLFVLYLSHKISEISVQKMSNAKRIFAIFLLVASSCSVYRYRENLLTDIFYRANEGIKRYDVFRDNLEKRKANINSNLMIDKSKADGVYVLVIGESQNKLHMSAYGYDRETTPWLDIMKDDKNFILFKNVYSCHTHTVPSLSYALTAKKQYNNMQLEKAVSLIEVVEAAGYDTAWISNQVKYGAWDTPTTVIASEANQQVWLNKNVGETTATNVYDGKLADALDNIQYKPNMLVIIHLMGNHGSYAQRYPRDFNRFTGKTVIDEYDNSILYNDYVMDKILSRAKQIPNFKGLMYVSDHADAVDQNLAHDSSRFVPQMTCIPMYSWFSSEYSADKLARIRDAADKKFTNDLLFNYVLSVMEIKSKAIYEEKNDLLSSEYDANPKRFKTLHGKKSI